jgi:hypothetical protein
MRSCVGVVKSLVHARHGTREARTHLAAGVCLRGDPQAWPEMGNASSRAEDLADADIDDANNVRRASSSFEGYVRGDGSSLSPPTSPLRPHSPRMFVPPGQIFSDYASPPRIRISSLFRLFPIGTMHVCVVDRLGFASGVSSAWSVFGFLLTLV